MKKIGEYAFLAGIIVAVLAGLAMQTGGWVAILLVLLGLVIGLLNITQKETNLFLIASIALLMAGSAGLENLPLIGGVIAAVISNVLHLVAPAAVIVALKTIYDLAKKK